MGAGLATSVLILVSSLQVRGEESDLEQDTLRKFFADRGMEIDLKKREVKVDVSVCLKKGIIEYVLCSPDSYEHESIFVTRTKPRHLHLALTLVGMRECPLNIPYFLWMTKSQKQQGSHVAIDVELEVDGEKGRFKLPEFLVNRADKETEVPNEWVFLGSALVEQNGKKVYAADLHGTHVSVVPNGGAVIQFGKQTGNPYQGEDQGFEVNPETVPAVGTRVKLIFKPAVASAPADSLKKK